MIGRLILLKLHRDLLLFKTIASRDLAQAPCPVTSALLNIVQRLTDPALKGQTISANAFVYALEAASKARLSRQQQDAQELLQLVLEHLHEEASARCKSQPYQNRAGVPPMEGKLESQVECLHCHYRPPARVSDFLMLSLHVPHQGTTSLDQCFDGLLLQEIIDDYVCANCKVQSVISAKRDQLAKLRGVARDNLAKEIADIESRVSSSIEKLADDAGFAASSMAPRRRIAKHTRIVDFPPVLVVHLSRSLFAADSSKNTAQVQFGEYLTLGSFDQRKYKLQCVVTHRGGHNSGHYETFRRRMEAEHTHDSGVADALDANRRFQRKNRHVWFGISDDKVRKCETKDVLSLQRECYLLLFEEHAL